MKISKRVRAIIGLVAIVLLVTIGILWNSTIREKVMTVNILTLKNDMQRGERVNAENIVIRKVSRTDLITGVLQSEADAQKLTQYEARQYIPAGSQLVAAYFEKPELVLKENQYIFAVPNDWILAVPATLRRKDEVYFYAISPTTNGMDISSSYNPYNAINTPAPTTEPANVTVDNPETPTPKSSGKVDSTATPIPPATVEPTATATAVNMYTPAPSLEERIQKAIQDGIKYEVKTVVAYVKDKSNNEIVTTSADVTGKMERLDGSGSIEHIEIIASKEQMDALQTAYLRGYRFIVLYQ